jgi:hypothetical protein
LFFALMTIITDLGGLCQVSNISDKYYVCRYGDPECLPYLWAEGLHVAYVPVYNTGSLS